MCVCVRSHGPLSDNYINLPLPYFLGKNQHQLNPNISASARVVLRLSFLIIQRPRKPLPLLYSLDQRHSYQLIASANYGQKHLHCTSKRPLGPNLCRCGPRRFDKPYQDASIFHEIRSAALVPHNQPSSTIYLGQIFCHI